MSDIASVSAQEPAPSGESASSGETRPPRADPRPAVGGSAPIPFVGMTREEMTEALSALGEPAYRARQVYEWIYARRADSFDGMTNLPRALRARLAAACAPLRPEIVRIQESADGTRKYLLEVPGGRIESVFMPEPSRVTFCISSQIGCALDCRFCLTARMNLTRHLKAGEIVSQALLMLSGNEIGARAVNVVFMGMGEPLHNYDEVLKAFRVLSDPEGVGIPRRRITLSTAGLVPGIRRLAQEPVRPRLAVSLNATTDEVRSSLMPINRKYPLADLLDAVSAFPLAPRERLTFEYVMLEGINASAEDARRLPALLRRHRIRAKVNLIPFNPGGGLDFEAPTADSVLRFQRALIAAGVACSVRKNRGRDISAACGQLAVPAPEPRPLE